MVSKPVLLYFPLFSAFTLSLAVACSPNNPTNQPAPSSDPMVTDLEIAADWETPPEELKNPFGEGFCSMGFEATVRNGPSKGTQLAGLLKFKTLENGQLADAKLFPAKGEPIAVDGQIVDGRAALNFHLAGGGVVAGTGDFQDKKDLCSGTLKGPLTGPQPGDSGDWLGDADGSAPINNTGNMIYSVTATNQVLYFDAATQTSRQIAGLAESNTDTLLNGPTGVVFLANQPSTSSLDNSHGLWISDTGNQRVVQYQLASGSWTKRREINLSTLQASGFNTASSFRPRGLTEYNRPIPRTSSNSISLHKMLLIADQDNHVVWAYSGNGTSNPRVNRFIGNPGMGLNSITQNSLFPGTQSPIAALVAKIDINGNTSDTLYYGLVPAVSPQFSTGFTQAPISLLPKRVNRGVDSLQITAETGCQQIFEYPSGQTDLKVFNESQGVFVGRSLSQPAPTPTPTPTPLLPPVNTSCGQAFCTSLPGAPSGPPPSLRYELLKTAVNQPQGCYVLENAFSARYPGLLAPIPSTAPTPTPSPTPSLTPLPTASPTPSPSATAVPSSTPTATPSPTPSATVTPAPQQGPSLMVSATEVTLAPGEVVNLTATAIDEKGNPSNNISWMSSDDKLINLSAKGPQASIEGLAEGRLEIVVDFPEAKLKQFIVVTVRAEKAAK